MAITIGIIRHMRNMVNNILKIFKSRGELYFFPFSLEQFLKLALFLGLGII